MRCIPNIQRLTKEDSIPWFEFDLCGLRYNEDHALETLFTKQKAKAYANLESLPRTQHKINIREVRTTSMTVFTQEQNKLFEISGKGGRRFALSRSWFE